MSEYVRGWTVMHAPTDEAGLSLAGFGIPTESLNAWLHLQSFFVRGEVTPCRDRHEWVSGKAADKHLAIKLCGDCVCRPACAEFAQANNETFGIWGGIDRSTT